MSFVSNLFLLRSELALCGRLLSIGDRGLSSLSGGDFFGRISFGFLVEVGSSDSSSGWCGPILCARTVALL